MMARCYLRVSTEDQAREGYSLGAQRDRLSAFAASQGWTVAAVYADEGVSARDMNRPALKRLLGDLQRGEVVLVYKLDRLTRNVADLDALLRRWEDEGVCFRSCTEDFNTTTAAGRLFIRLVADLAQWERENLGERTRMGMTRRAQEGQRNGGPAPFGYEAVIGSEGKLCLVPGAGAPVVRELFERYVAGDGVRRLTLWLNGELRLTGPRGGAFSDSTVSGILKNPVYAGLVAWGRAGGGEAVLSEGRHEPLVSRELWTQAQAVRAGRAGQAPRHAAGEGSLLAGLGRCGLCGGYLKLVRSGGRRYLAYRCGNYAARGTCTVAGVPAGQVEAGLVAALCSLAPLLVDPERGRRLAREYLAESAPEPKAIGREIGRMRRAMNAWDQLLEQGRIAPEEWAGRTERHRARLAQLEADLTVAAGHESAGPSVEQVAAVLADLRAVWTAATAAERKTLARAFCREVRVFPDRPVAVLPREVPV